VALEDAAAFAGQGQLIHVSQAIESRFPPTDILSIAGVIRVGPGIGPDQAMEFLEALFEPRA
jgi:hypothetical protein